MGGEQQATGAVSCLRPLCTNALGACDVFEIVRCLHNDVFAILYRWPRPCAAVACCLQQPMAWLVNEPKYYLVKLCIPPI